MISVLINGEPVPFTLQESDMMAIIKLDQPIELDDVLVLTTDNELQNKQVVFEVGDIIHPAQS